MFHNQALTQLDDTQNNTEKNTGLDSLRNRFNLQRITMIFCFDENS